jgi:hypothetical protein
MVAQFIHHRVTEKTRPFKEATAEGFAMQLGFSVSL